MYEYCEIGIHLILIFPIPERNADKYIFRAMISKKCLDFPKKISGNQVPMFPTFCMSGKKNTEAVLVIWEQHTASPKY